MIVQSYIHSRTKWRQTCLWWFFLCLALWGPSLAHRPIVGVPPFKMYLIRARCQAYCNEQFGYQERKLQIDLFHNYQPFMCQEKFVSSCTQCSSVCTNGSHILETCLSDCATNCSSECKEDSGNLESCLSDCSANKTVTCRESCQFLRNVYEEESKDINHYIRARNLTGAAVNLTLVQPNVICTYTQLISHTKNPTSFMRVRWNVLDTTGHFAAVPLAFVVALKDSTSNTPQWSFIGKMNFSVVPIYNLKPNTSYKVKVVAVHSTGFVDGSQESEWIRTPQASAVLEKPVDIRVSRQYIRGGTLRAILEWKPPLNSGGCFFRLYSMPMPPKGIYDYLETQFWGELRYELKKLMFNSNYTVEILNFDEGYESSSQPAKITFHTIDCLNATDYNYNICAPEEPSNVRLSNAPMYRNQQGRPMSDIYVMWEPPKYSRYRNTISNYTLIYRKAPDMFNARKIEPHRDMVFLPGTATNYTILYCHWDSVYEVSLRAHSPGGHSSEAQISITLGNGYAEYYETAELSENKAETVTEDKTVQYAATVPVVVGVSAVLFCLVYIRKIKSRKQMGVTKEILCREEINPIYECATTKEESELLVVDEYEIETSALRFTDIVGEGAFGKVIKAELIGTPVIDQLPENRIVAVKMLKEHATPDERRNLLLEIEAMKQLGQHRNIVSLIACVTTSSRPCLVMHYCPLGDLRNYLRKHRAKNASRRGPSSLTSAGCGTLLNSGDSGISYNCRLSNPPKPCTDPISLYCSQNNSRQTNNTETTDKSDSPLLDDETDTISQNVLLSYARQIALGMEYLAQRKFIHRDLAARNILLYTHRHLKISDFGLARDVYETSVYQPTSARKLPYKWMPIESIFDQIFTIKSDVWSFGILLWEIVTLGGCPYPGIPNQDLFKLLKEGYRMEKPENCSLEIYKMMLSCWHPKPEDRPSFTQLRLTFEKSLEATQVYIDLDVPVCQDCYDHDQDSSNSIGIDQAFGSARVAPEDSRFLTMDGVITTAADVHICHLFHGNSSDRNLTLGVAEGLIIRAEPEEGGLSDSHGLYLDAPSSSNDDSNELRPATNCETECEPRFRSRSELEMTDKDGNNVNAENDSLSEPTQRQSSLHAHTSSSSTDLTCDCDSADTVSDTSLSSSRNAERVQHAPSLTFGLLSLLSKAGQLRRNRKSQNRQSVSLTDVNSIGGEGLDDRDLGFRPSSSSLAHV